MGLIYLATSKYGNIRLGEGKPEYSTLSWLFMFICAGLGSSTLYWGLEWAYYYQTPGLNIAPRSQQALEFSVPYSFLPLGHQRLGNLYAGLINHGLSLSCA